MILSKQPSPALISTGQQGFHFPPFECTHLLLVPHCVYPRRFLMSTFFFSSQSVSNFPCLALGGSSLCSSSQQTSHPKSIQPSPIRLFQEDSSLGACVLNNSFEHAVASSEVLLYILILEQICTEIWQLYCTATPVAGAGVWVICCCC